MDSLEPPFQKARKGHVEPPADNITRGKIAQSGVDGNIQADGTGREGGDGQGLVKPVLVIPGAPLARKATREQQVAHRPPLPWRRRRADRSPGRGQRE